MLSVIELNCVDEARCRRRCRSRTPQPQELRAEPSALPARPGAAGAAVVRLHVDSELNERTKRNERYAVSPNNLCVSRVSALAGVRCVVRLSRLHNNVL